MPEVWLIRSSKTEDYSCFRSNQAAESSESDQILNRGLIPFTKIQEAYLERSEPTERADKETNVKKLPVRHVEFQRHPDKEIVL